MNKKIIIGLVVILIAILSLITVVNAAELDVVRDFDNTTIYHAEKSDYGSQKVSGIENNAKLVTTGTGSQKTIEIENGYYEYSFLSDENNVRLNSTDKVKFNYNRTLTANYEFYPFMFAEINIIDLHGHTGSCSNYPAMKTASDSITKTFKEYTDVEEGYRPLYILDIDTNTKYQPGDKFTITYQDVANTGLTKMIKTFQYIYAKDIVIENIIVENRTIYNDTIINRDIYNDTIINRTIYNDTIINRDVYNDTIINRTIYNDTIINRDIYNDTIINRTIYNDTIINREIFNDTIVNRTFYNDTIINREIYNDTIVNRTIYNDTIINRDIYNDTIINRDIYNDTIINRTIYNDTIVNRTIYNDTIINRTIYNDTIVNRTIYNDTIVNRTIYNDTIVNRTIENITEEIKNVTEKEEIKNVPETIPTKEVINEPVKKVVNNTSVIQNNENKTVKVLNNNTTKANTITTNINDENNTSTPTSNNVKMIKMMKTGSPIAWLMAFVFIIALATFAIRDKE